MVTARNTLLAYIDGIAFIGDHTAPLVEPEGAAGQVLMFRCPAVPLEERALWYTNAHSAEEQPAGGIGARR
jgi:hypothetical protein